ncbi:hypothetical protein B0T16DRAFT_454419 [Cercophora newfieldiana]|uniref:Uncharacterized protein n=1 Tax=Cercophora newfieldiana TaxID=92897 RepID=A0AA39YG42_9PEZI|nr:hypothetical protein B0T16DRAFT_454419 [Cercophora newfieldiana]
MDKITSPDRASNSSAQTNDTVVSSAGRVPGGGALLTPAPDNLISQLPNRESVYRPPHQAMHKSIQRSQGNRGDGGPVTDHKSGNSHADRGFDHAPGDRGTGTYPANRGSDRPSGPSEGRGFGKLITGPSMINNPGIPERMMGYPPPVMAKSFADTAPPSSSKQNVPLGPEAPPFIPGRPVPLGRSTSIAGSLPSTGGPFPDRVSQLRASPSKSSLPWQQGTDQGSTVGSDNQSNATSHQSLLGDIATLHARLYGLAQGTLKRSDLPNAFKDGFQVDSQQLIKGLFALAGRTESLIQALANLQKENATVQKTIGSTSSTSIDMARERQMMERYRSEVNDEIEKLTRALEEETAKNQRLQRSLIKAEEKMQEDAVTIMTLQDYCGRLKEQVDAKRNLWMTIHPKDRAWAESQISQQAQSNPAGSASGRDHRDHPTPAETSITGSWRTPRTAEDSTQLFSPNTSLLGHRASQQDLRPASLRLTPGSSRTGAQFAAGSNPGSAEKLSDIRSKSVLGSDYSNPMRQISLARRGDLSSSFGNLSLSSRTGFASPALFDPRNSKGFPTVSEAGSPVTKPTDTFVGGWEEKFGVLWRLISGFCVTWAPGPGTTKKDVPTHLKSKAPEMWRMLCLTISQATDQKSAEKVAYTLLRDQDARQWVTMRVLTQFIVEKAFDIRWYLGFTAESDNQIRGIAEALRANDADAQGRLAALQRQKQMVGAIRGHPKWPRFRQHRLSEFAKEVQEVVWNLLPDDLAAKARETANYDLFAVTEKAIDLAGEAMLSEHEFTFGWHRAGAPFTAAAMRAVESPAGFSEHHRSENWRLRLGITPTVTARALEGMRIVPLLVQRAQVLVAN